MGHSIDHTREKEQIQGKQGVKVEEEEEQKEVSSSGKVILYTLYVLQYIFLTTQFQEVKKGLESVPSAQHTLVSLFSHYIVTVG